MGNDCNWSDIDKCSRQPIPNQSTKAKLHHHLERLSSKPHIDQEHFNQERQ